MNKNYNFNGKNILVVDDDKSSALLVKLVLEDIGAGVISVEDGKTAIEIASSRYIDLILMDIRMPIMDGFTATEKIRKFDSKVPIIAYTAWIFPHDKQQCIDAGCNDYLQKGSFDREKMLDMIEKYLY